MQCDRLNHTELITLVNRGATDQMFDALIRWHAAAPERGLSVAKLYNSLEPSPCVNWRLTVQGMGEPSADTRARLHTQCIAFLVF
jgi:hypothetical protein